MGTHTQISTIVESEDLKNIHCSCVAFVFNCFFFYKMIEHVINPYVDLYYVGCFSTKDVLSS